MTCELAWVEHLLPGADGAARVALARELDLALEVACRPELDVAALASARVVTVQAYGMHSAHPLHADARQRAAGAAELERAIELASELGAAHVIAVCGYGPAPSGDPFELCRAFFAARADCARAHGVRILVEPLSPLRAGAMTDPRDVARLIHALAAPDVFAAALDTGHILDSGLDPLAVLRAFDAPVAELQLRGPGSRAPTGDEPLRAWLAELPRAPDVVAVEHREVQDEGAVRALVRRLRQALGDRVE